MSGSLLAADVLGPVNLLLMALAVGPEKLDDAMLLLIDRWDRSIPLKHLLEDLPEVFQRCSEELRQRRQISEFRQMSTDQLLPLYESIAKDVPATALMAKVLRERGLITDAQS